MQFNCKLKELNFHSIPGIHINNSVPYTRLFLAIGSHNYFVANPQKQYKNRYLHASCQVRHATNIMRQDKQVYFRKNKSSACQLLALCNTTGRKRTGTRESIQKRLGVIPRSGCLQSSGESLLSELCKGQVLYKLLWSNICHSIYFKPQMTEYSD